MCTRSLSDNYRRTRLSKATKKKPADTLIITIASVSLDCIMLGFQQMSFTINTITFIRTVVWVVYGVYYLIGAFTFGLALLF